MVTRSGVGTTSVTLSDRGTKDSKVEDPSEHHGCESMYLPDSLSQYKSGSTGFAGEPRLDRR
jgi:hypothetical protein